MRIAVLTILAGAVVAGGNPVVEKLISEVSGVEGGAFVELLAMPYGGGPKDLRGWTIETSTSCCTLLCSLDSREWLVIDSAVLAAGSLACGTFSANPDSDRIVLRDFELREEILVYPGPVCSDSSLPPGPRGSVCRLNPYGTTASMSWYVDSTPTPGDSNDDCATVSGTVRGSGGQVFDAFYASAYGPSGRGIGAGYGLGTYEVMGLNPGSYHIEVEAFIGQIPYRASFPDSVSVPYATRVTGIDVVIPMTGIRESEVSIRPALLGPGVLLDVSGRKVMELGPGENDIRRLRPGAYFLRREEDDYTHKVVVQR